MRELEAAGGDVATVFTGNDIIGDLNLSGRRNSSVAFKLSSARDLQTDEDAMFHEDLLYT